MVELQRFWVKVKASPFNSSPNGKWLIQTDRFQEIRCEDETPPSSSHQKYRNSSSHAKLNDEDHLESISVEPRQRNRADARLPVGCGLSRLPRPLHRSLADL